MSNNQLLFPLFRAMDSTGVPLSGGKVFTYQAGTSTPLATYTDSTLGTPNTNPVILDTQGYPLSGGIWLNPGSTYKIDVQDSNGISIDNFPQDNYQNTAGAQGPAGTFQMATASGTSDAITATYSPALTLSNLTTCGFVATAANTTTTPTFAPNGLTAHTITKRGGAPLVAGDIAAALAVSILEYNSANTRWELLNPAATLSNAGVGTITNTNIANMAAALSLINNSSANGTGTGIVLQPSTISAQGWQIRAQNDGSDNITLSLLSLIAGSGTFRLKLPFAGGVTIGSATGTPTDGQVNATAYLINGVQIPLVQQVSTSTVANTLINATIPADDTIPQSSEGTQILSLAITPTSASNILEFDATFFVGEETNVDSQITAALFQGAGANAIFATAGGAASSINPSATGVGGTIRMFFRMTSGTTSATTFTIRVGANSGNLRLNGAAGGRFYGGVAASTFVIREMIT